MSERLMEMRGFTWTVKTSSLTLNHLPWVLMLLGFELRVSKKKLSECRSESVRLFGAMYSHCTNARARSCKHTG